MLPDLSSSPLLITKMRIKDHRTVNISTHERSKTKQGDIGGRDSTGN